jgi:hypothetical protein
VARVFTLPQGKNLPLTEKSDIVLVFEETDDGLVERMKLHLPADDLAADDKRHLFY